ncbi:MAG: CYTH domain-containing protein [Ruminococcus sp.]|nr:CYTH domain-containing protein [Ruminococcus sp.]
MAEELEIERKFLVEFPDLKKLDVKRKISIIQTYLHRGKNDSQRRVRRLEENGKVFYTYTEKIFISPTTRKETEYDISCEDYEKLLDDADKTLTPVDKVRFCFKYRNQLFELDTYPFSDKLAVMEIELDSTGQVIDFPDSVRVIKDVTADSRYSNAALSAAGVFPDVQPDDRSS